MSFGRDRQRGKSQPVTSATHLVSGGAAPTLAAAAAWPLTLTLILTLILAAILLPLLAGCGKKSEPDAVVLATVGDEDITVGSYKIHLASTDPAALPLGADGHPLDTALPEGKLAFLQTLIDQAVMVQKARQLGYDRDSDLSASYEYLLSFHAVTTMHADEVDDPATFVSDEEVDVYYARLSEKRRCEYIITQFRDDAVTAREEILAGKDWQNVAREYHDGEVNPRKPNEIVFESGRLKDTFEREIFRLEINEVSEPIETTYGWWLIRLLSVSRGAEPPFPRDVPEVIESVYLQQLKLGHADILASVRDSYQFKLDETALFIIYNGLPTEREQVRQRQRNSDVGATLAIPVAELDRELFSYILDGETIAVTIGDYKGVYERMHPQAQPNDSLRFGELRQLVTQNVEKSLMQYEAKKRGYHEDPRVLLKTRQITDDMMVERLVTEMVDVNERISAADMDAFWTDHAQDYHRPEARYGHAIVCVGPEEAERAYQEIRAGAEWSDVIQRHGIASDAGERSGELGPVYINSENPLREQLFALQRRGVTRPFAVDGSWYVVRCDSIAPPHQPELSEVRSAVGQRMKIQRRNQAISEMLTDWQSEFAVVVYEERLVDLPSWQQLTADAPQDAPQVAPQVAPQAEPLPATTP